MKTKTSVNSYSFLELVIALASIALIASLLIPNLVNSSEKVRKNQCLTNLAQIQRLKYEWSKKTNARATAIPTVANLFGTNPPPICPSGGTYGICAVGLSAKCSHTNCAKIAFNHVLPIRQ